MQTLYGSSGLSELGNETINVNGDITVAEANAIDLLTTGDVIGFIDSSERVSNLVTLTGNNSYNVTVSSDDATSATAAQLNAINDATSVAVDLSNVTAIAASSLNDLNILQTAINGNEFSNSSGLTTIAVSDTSVDATLLDTVIERFDFINGLSTTNMTLASGATINVDANEVTSLLADETAGRLTINDQIITVNNPITVDQANSLAATTTGVVTATILSTESIEELGTLDAVGDNISIIIPDGSATASQLLTLAQSTTALVDASAVTKLASDNIDNIEKLLTAGNDITQFTSDSFSLLANVSVSDTTLDVSLLNEAIVQANLATDATSTLFNIADANTINGGTEIDFTKLLTNETSNQVDISDQNLTVDTGTLSVSNANLLDATTSGIVTANIATDSTVDSLATLTGTGNAYTIVIGSGDATGSNASDLIAIDNATTVAVDASSITELTGSNTDIATLYASAGFQI